MPSCVIKTCRNHSGLMKKSQGITFHRFPKGNEVWRNDWLQIIRECRGEPNWIPSKSSVICSVHFDANDLYRTAKGLLRVINYAVPTKLLSAPPGMGEEKSTELDILNTSQESLLVIETAASSLDQPLKLEECGPVKMEQCDPVKIDQCDPLKLEQCDHLGSLILPGLSAPPEMQEEKSTAPHISNTSQKSSLVIGVAASSLEQPLKLEPSDPLSTSLILSQNSPEIEAAAPDLEQSVHVKTFENLRLKYSLTKKQKLIEKQKKKIKVLNQKIRRLENRNRSLKDNIKAKKKIIR